MKEGKNPDGAGLAWFLLWMASWVGGTGASGIFGLLFGHWDAMHPTDHEPLDAAAGLIFGLFIGGVLCAIVYSNVAVISWLIGLQRAPRILPLCAAVLAGSLIGAFEYFWMLTIPTLVLGTSLMVEIYLRHSPAAEPIFLQAQLRRTAKHGQQFTLSDLLLRITVVAILILCWKSFLSDFGNWW